MLYKNLSLLLFFCLISFTGFAQKGTIRGQIIDDETGEPLIGATVLIEGTTTGAATDLDGKYTIANLAAGNYNIQSSYVSYQTQTIQGVAVKDNDVTLLNIRLKSESVGLQEVVVEAQALQNSETSLLTAQRKASLVFDGISAEQFSRSGDSDAAAAIRRVTGVSVESGKYVFVRGLGDRYSKTALNNAEIPGLDPDRNSVQMDLFPSNLIDNMVIYKTFSPELPASFTGGFVNVTTKDFPERLTMQISASAGFNTNATFNNNFLSQDLSNTFPLGFSNNTRAVPDIVKAGVPLYDQALLNPNEARRLDATSKAFKGSYIPTTATPLPNHSLAFSFGNQKSVFGRPLGFVGGITYQRSYEFYENGQTGRYFLAGPSQDRLDAILDASDIRGNESVLWGALLNTTYKFNPNNKIGINLMRNQSADVSSRYQQGVYPYRSGIDDESAQRQIRSQLFLERSITSGQVRGEHALNNTNPIKINWLAAYTLSTQDEPDLRFFNNTFSNAFVDTTYVAVGGSNTPPVRYYRDMEETNIDSKFNVEVPVKFWGDLPSKIRFGGAYIVKDRNFDEFIYEFAPQGAARDLDDYNGDVDAYMGNENLGIISGEPGNYQFGIIVRNQALAGGSYNGREMVPAGYAMVDLQATKGLKVSAGARFERTDIELTNESLLLAPEDRIARLENNDFLPALNITQQLSEKMNLRLAYGRTLARPTFRELANYTTFDFLGDAQLTGSNDLQRTIIDNVDVRWENFMKAGEIISISAFYKIFQNPIEKTISTFTNEPDRLRQNFRNVDRATVMGMELELRKDLAFITPVLKNFKVGGNFTFLDSRVDINEGELALIRLYQPDAPATRPLNGQAPFLINANASYNSEDSDLGINVVYNVSGERLSVVSIGGTPNIYEQPRNVLDVNIRKGFGSRFSARLSANNLLNAQFRFTQQYRDEDYIFQAHRLGRTFSLSLTYLLF